MSLLELKCLNCGAKVSIEPNCKKGFCEHCKTEYITEDLLNNYYTTNNYNTTQFIVKNIYGKESLDISDLIKNGEVFFSLGEILKAEDCFIQAITNNPADYRGWLGIVKIKTKNFTDWKEKTHIEFLEKAKKVATEKQLQEIEEQYKFIQLKIERYNRYKDEKNKKFNLDEKNKKQEFIDKINIQKDIFRENGLCQHCGGAFKKKFIFVSTNICSRCGLRKDY